MYNQAKMGKKTRLVSHLAPGRGIRQPGTGVQPTGRRVQVLDSHGKNVTPLPLYHAKPGEIQPKPGGLFLNELFSKSGSFNFRPYTSDSPTQTPATFAVPWKIDSVTQHVTEECLDEIVDIYFTETDTVSLLDIPSTLVSEADVDAEAIKKKNAQYRELCRMRMGSDKYVAQAVQTLSAAPKEKQIQCNNIAMVEKEAVATCWDIYDLFANQNEVPSTVDTNKGQEKRLDPQDILLPESFQHTLLVMERNLLANIFQPKLAAYRGLAILEGKPENEQQIKEGQESPLTPTLEPLWAFSCRITKGCNITSMAWNKKNPDLLAVGYGSLDSRNQRPSFICCWSLKNFKWPERVFHCHSCVTSLDFSANNPSQLAVGMLDGTVAIYNVTYQDNGACVANSRKCLKKHLHPVWQVIWKKQDIGLGGEEWEEVLISVSADGRITKWLLSSSGLDSCLTDLMNLKKHERDKNTLAAVTPGLCIAFHPTNYNIYLVGMGNGLIHMCSLAICDAFLETYETHISSVNYIEWSLFSPKFFLSCSSDWTIQLWKQGHFAPLLSFTSTQRAVYTAKWSPNWPTVFAAINEQQLEIWNLNSNTRSPTIVHHSAPGVEMKALLFATETDCVLVGDSDGKVTVYKLQDITVGESIQVDNLDDVIKSSL